MHQTPERQTAVVMHCLKFSQYEIFAGDVLANFVFMILSPNRKQ